MLGIWVISVMVGLFFYAFAGYTLVRGDTAKTTATSGQRGFHSTSVGITLAVLGLVACPVLPIVYPRFMSDDSNSQVSTTPLRRPTEPSATPSGALDRPPNSDVSGTTAPSVKPSINSGETASSHASTPTSGLASTSSILSVAGPWQAESGGIEVVIEACGKQKAVGGRWGCRVRLENSAGNSIYLAGSEPVLIVDSNDQSYDIDAKSTTFPLNPYASLQDQQTWVGIVVPLGNIPENVHGAEVRLSVVSSMTNLKISVPVYVQQS